VFDPILLKGVIAYFELRTSIKRLSLNMFTDPVPKSEQIREAISALCSRTTSWLSDEAVCLAIILGMDVGKVQEAQGQNRMKTLASMWQEAPSELAFRGLKRMQGDGFGWMPQSFLGAGRGSIVPRTTGKQQAYRSKRGLCSEAQGVMFDLAFRRPKGQLLAQWA
jgi:hypothetical protein